MKTSHKIWLVISGILLIVLGVMCIAKPAATLFSTAWLLGCFTLFSGISKMVFTFRTQHFLPNSGTRMLSGLLQIIIGVMFLSNNLFVAMSLPVAFALWVTIEGLIIAVQSFDYKKVGFGSWWALLLFGIAAVVFGFLGMKNPDVSAKTLSLFIGVGIIVAGLAYLLAVAGINRFEKKVEDVCDALRG